MKSTLLSLFLLLQCLATFALIGSQVTIKRATAPFFMLDSNTPCTAGPRAAYIGVKIINNTSDTLFGVNVRLDSIVGNSLFRLVGPSDSTLNVGRLLPNDSNNAYFYVKYPCTHDLPAIYYFRVSDDSTGTVGFNTTVTTRSSISASAGGLVDSSKIGFYDALGTIMTDTVIYTLGNIQVGDEIEFQPNGDSTFNANKVLLLNSIIVSSDLATIPVGQKDQFYFLASVGTGGTNNKVKIVFYYKNLLYNDSTTINPYSGTTSGNTNFKYSGNYGARVGGFRTTTNSLKINTLKRASCGICTPCDTFTYTIRIDNTFTQIVQIDQLIDVMPINYKFVSIGGTSDVNATNSSLLPDAGDSGTIYFQGFISDALFPFESYIIPPQDSIFLIYDAIARCTSSEALDTNTVYTKIGDIIMDTAIAVTCAGCIALPVNLMYFKAQLVEKKVDLTWATASELNCKSYTLERSYDGNNFESIGVVPGAGNSWNILNYRYPDVQWTPQAHTYYRLIQEDYDGNTHTFVTSLSLNARKTIVIHPNPAWATQEFYISELVSGDEIQITDQTGRNVFRYRHPEHSYEESIQISTLNWSKGVYFIHSKSSNGHLMSEKLILK